MGDAVHLHQVHGTVGAGEQPVPGSVDHDLPGVPVDPVQFDIGRTDALPRLKADAKPVRADPGDPHPVADATQLEFQLTATLMLHLRATAEGRGQQPLLFNAFFFLVRRDGGGGQGNGGMPVRHEPSRAANPVDPAGVSACIDDFGLAEEVEHETLVGRATVDDHHEPAQPAQSLGTVPAMGDDLRDHRVEVGGDGVAFTHPGVHPDAGSGRQLQPRDAAWGGREVPVGILGVEPGLDGMPTLHRRLPPTAGSRTPPIAGL